MCQLRSLLTGHTVSALMSRNVVLAWMTVMRTQLVLTHLTRMSVHVTEDSPAMENLHATERKSTLNCQTFTPQIKLKIIQ